VTIEAITTQDFNPPDLHGYRLKEEDKYHLAVHQTTSLTNTSNSKPL
jgi:hypothetical protein